MYSPDISGCSLPIIDSRRLNRSNSNNNLTVDSSTNMRISTNMCIPEEYNNYPEFRKVIHDIRNMIVLSDERLKMIETFSDSEKIEIIVSLNGIVENMIDVINSMY